MKSNKIKSLFKILSNVLIYAFIALCVFGVLVSTLSKKDADGTATIFNRQVRFVLTESMEKCDETDVSGYKIKDIKQKSLVFIKVVPKDAEEQYEFYKSLDIGDVLTFKYTYATQETITHRIVDIKENDNGGFIIKLEGDNKNSDSKTLTQVIDTSNLESTNYVIGKVTGTSYFLGLLVYVLKSKIGLIFVVILPCLIITVFQIIKIINVVNAGKKKKREQDFENQQNEIELLKKQLEELKAKNEEPKSAEE